MQIFLNASIGSTDNKQKDKNKYTVKKGEGLLSVIRNVMKEKALEVKDSTVYQIYKQVKNIEAYKELAEGKTINVKPIIDEFPKKEDSEPKISPKGIKDSLNRYYTIKKGEGLLSIVRAAMQEKGVYITDELLNEVHSSVKDLDVYKELKADEKVDLKYIWDAIPEGNDTKYKVQKSEGIYTIIKKVVSREKGLTDESLVNRIYSSVKDNKDYKYLKVGETIDLTIILGKLNQDKVKNYTVKKGDTYINIIKNNLDIYTAEKRPDLSKEEIDVFLQRIGYKLGNGKKIAVGEKIDLTKAKELINNSQLNELKEVEDNYTTKVIDKKTGEEKKVYVKKTKIETKTVYKVAEDDIKETSNTKLDNSFKYEIRGNDNFERIAKKIQRKHKLNVSFVDIQAAIRKANPNVHPRKMRLGQKLVIPTEFPMTDEVYPYMKNKTAYLKNNLSDVQRKSLMDLKKHLSNPSHVAIYKKVAKKADVPMELVIALHWRESTGDFNTYLHNGQNLGKTTTIKPKGVYFKRGQFITAALDALKRKSNYKIVYRINKDSKDEAALNSYAMRYNGLGAYSAGKSSSYVFAGTTAYTKGKYTSDGNYNPNEVDQQLGTAVIIDYLLCSKEGRGLLD